MYNKKIIILTGIAVIGLGLAACNSGESSAHGIYSCDRGGQLDVTFTAGKKVVIVAGGQTYTLDRVDGSSGAQYEGDGSSFYSMGVDAKFMPKGAKPSRCRRN